MKKSRKPRATVKTPKLIATPRAEERYMFRLYVAGETPRSTAAVTALDKLCKEHLQGRYELQVIDLYKHPHLAKEKQLVALPMLVKTLPAPLRLLIGNLSEKEKVVFGLDLQHGET
jgi:circadian clock protein KaiB